MARRIIVAVFLQRCKTPLQPTLSSDYLLLGEDPATGKARWFSNRAEVWEDGLAGSRIKKRKFVRKKRINISQGWRVGFSERH